MYDVQRQFTDIFLHLDLLKFLDGLIDRKNIWLWKTKLFFQNKANWRPSPTLTRQMTVETVKVVIFDIHYFYTWVTSNCV